MSVGNSPAPQGMRRAPVLANTRRDIGESCVAYPGRRPDCRARFCSLTEIHPNNPWGLAIGATLHLGAQFERPSFSIHSPLTRFNTKEYEDLLGTYLRAKYRDKSIGAVVVHGPQALELFMTLRADLWSKVPVVFASVSESTVARLKLPPDVTGPLRKCGSARWWQRQERLYPTSKRIALVGDPFERQPFRRLYLPELREFSKELEVIDLSGLPVATLKERVAALPGDTATSIGQY